MQHNNSTLNGLIHMENTSGVCYPSPQDPRITVKHYSLILARAGNLAHAGKFFRNGRTFCATPLGLREPPELPSQAPGNPLHDPLWSSPSYIREHGLSATQKGRVSPITRKRLSLLPMVVRRHQQLPLGRQPRSPECSTHFSLSI